MVGERLREVRLSQSLSLLQVAKKAGISAATLSRIETNKQSVEIALFLSIARILKIAPKDLLSADEAGEGDPDPLVRRIATLGPVQLTKLWRDLAASRRSDRASRRVAVRSLGQQVEELVAQIEFLREEIEGVRSRIKRRK